MQVCERFSPVRKDVLLRVVDVWWKTTLLSSRRASNRSRQVESLAGLDLGHADRYPLSLVYPVVVGGRVGLSGGGQVGGLERRRSGVGECVELAQIGLETARCQGRVVVNDRLLAAAVAAV